MLKLKLIHPVKEVFITQRFGEHAVDYTQIGLQNGHNGYDYRASTGTEILAMHDGTVTFTGEDGGGGLTLVIRTDEMFEYNGGESFFKTIYCHLKKDSFKVKPGDKVKAGQVVALANNTGFSTGPHLHIGLKPIYKGEQDWQWFNLESQNGFFGAIDPTPYLPITQIKNKYTFTRNLKFGMRGEDVKALQVILKELGYFEYPEITGYYGSQTKVAVLAFQHAYKVCTPIESMYGYYAGPKTLLAIRKLF